MPQKNRIRSFFADGNNKLIFSMFFPILTEQLILTMTGAVYSVMLANIKSDAMYIISAVNMAEQINQFAYSLLGSVSIGAAVVVSQYIGAGNEQSAKAAAEQALSLGFVFALIFAAAFTFFGADIYKLFLGKDKAEGMTFVYAMKYMRLSVLSYPLLNIGATSAGVIRGTGDAKSPMRISIITGILNAAVAGVCIYVFDMNIYGAGIASIVSRFFGALAAALLLAEKGYVNKFSNMFKPKLLYIKQILRIGLYESAESLIFQFGRTLTYRYFTGDAHIAANSVAVSIFGILSAPGESMCVVAMTLVGRFTGAGDKKNSYKILRNTVLLSMGMILLINVVFLPLSPFVISLYTNSFDGSDLELIRELIYRLAVLNSIFVPAAWSAAFVLVSGIKGAGDVRFTTVSSVICMWLVRVLFAYILGDLCGWGVIGVWCGMFFDWVVRGVIAFIRFKSRKWQDKSAV